MHPNTYDPVLSWKSPVSANVSVTSMWARLGSGGDGVYVSSF